MTPREVASELGVNVRTVQRWIADGRLPALRLGSRVRVLRSSLGAVADVTTTAAPRPINTLLIANRGEIAVRIARTARRMGVRVIGVHEAGERAPEGVDESHIIGSYLDGTELLAVARGVGADAIHPGYGFLAENPTFARAVTAAGIIWVGPPAKAIGAMGDKAAARCQAAALGIPILPGYDGEVQADATLVAEAARVGYPLLVKPSAGGGGKGMRVVRAAAELPEALEAARREAHRSFGDDRLILERYLVGPRHVEIQVLFDAYGNGVHLGERDCSAQRRNQKIVEEAPAPSVRSDLRARMGESALKVASAVGYVSAGTVEMLLTDAGEFFFLEMNTRLQVEHPVTERVTGRDLVEDQLRIAAGAFLAELDIQEPQRISGHAIEARIYAEDPEAGFLPATGRLMKVAWPAGVRIDTGVREGDVVSDRYDPMLAKLIVHARTRRQALDLLRKALDRTSVLGVKTNLRFLRWLVRQEPMRTGEVRTDTIETLDPPPLRPLDDGDWAGAAAKLTSGDRGIWGGGWRLNGHSVVRLASEGTQCATIVSPQPIVWAAIEGAKVHVDIDGQSVEFELAPPPTIEEAVRNAVAGGAEGTSVLTAPMPGRVIAVRATDGTSVKAGQPVVIIEAMKMEHAVLAPMDGTLKLTVKEGQQVRRGDMLADIAPMTP
ncbi:MAG: excisionase family DNA-binding protein [Chloroflexota bacterium]|nr:excisionase family DNA-binding protein [Chloroflexota bacterium]